MRQAATFATDFASARWISLSTGITSFLSISEICSTSDFFCPELLFHLSFCLYYSRYSVKCNSFFENFFIFCAVRPDACPHIPPASRRQQKGTRSVRNVIKLRENTVKFRGKSTDLPLNIYYYGFVPLR